MERFDRQLGTAGRIGRENWIEQAQILSRGGDTKFSLNYDRGVRPGAEPAPRPVKLGDAIQEHASRPARPISARSARPAPRPIRMPTPVGARCRGQGRPTI